MFIASLSLCGCTHFADFQSSVLSCSRCARQTDSETELECQIQTTPWKRIRLSRSSVELRRQANFGWHLCVGLLKLLIITFAVVANMESSQQLLSAEQTLEIFSQRPKVLVHAGSCGAMDVLVMQYVTEATSAFFSKRCPNLWWQPDSLLFSNACCSFFAIQTCVGVSNTFIDLLILKQFVLVCVTCA